ncbi:substrate-binding domain-containing protein [Nakamurella sp. YIM 132087]|uniref:Substrate-binding domain-containing protein n=1 Tax=Nakamurella alba TaxID=2665158 RepID=A0A7K1FRW7_9ACTN|nr:sugar ABC transporter substrate-binding protein [Nakamurella alba]MTD16892.1 substrate-binding domain-containing protein [Nakamurella alba]
MKSWTFRVIGVAAAGVLLAGCGTGGKAATTSEAASAGGAGAIRDLNYAVVIHGNPDGSFWNVVKRGAEDAATQFRVNVEITGDVEGANQAKLIDAALAKKPTGLVVSMANPDALKASLENATSQGIPFVTINSGAEVSAEFGAIGHVGQTETVAGEGAGTELKNAGATKLICVIHEAGNIGLEQRCKGAAETFGGTVENLQVDLANPQGIQSTVKSKLLGDKSIDGVLSLNPDVAVAALAGVKDAGSSAKVGTFDINADVLKSIEAGDILFAVDQQQYLQGYLPIAMLVLYHDNLNTVGGGLPVLTGPAFITKDNVATVSDLVSKGTR